MSVALGLVTNALTAQNQNEIVALLQRPPLNGVAQIGADVAVDAGGLATQLIQRVSAARDVAEVRVAIREVLYPGAPGGVLPVGVNIDAGMLDDAAALRCIGQARYTRLAALANVTPALAGILASPHYQNEITAHLAAHEFGAAELQALQGELAGVAVGVGEGAAIQGFLTARLGLAAATMTAQGIVDGNASIGQLRGQARYTRLAALANVTPALAGILASPHYQNEITAHLAAHEFGAAELQALQGELAGVAVGVGEGAAIQGFLTARLGLAAATMTAQGIVDGNASIGQLRGQARYTRLAALANVTPALAGILASPHYQNEITAHLAAHEFGAAELQALQGELAGVAVGVGEGAAIQGFLTARLGLAAATMTAQGIVDGNASIGQLRGQARYRHWILPEINRLNLLDPNHPVKRLLENNRASLEIHLGTINRTQPNWIQEFLTNGLHNANHDRAALTGICRALGIAIPADPAADNITPGIYARNQKASVESLLRTKGFPTVAAGLEAVGDDVAVINRLTTADVQSFRRDIQNPYTSSERLSEIFTKLNVPANDARTMANEIRNNRPTVENLNLIESPLFRKFVYEIYTAVGLTADQIGLLNDQIFVLSGLANAVEFKNRLDLIIPNFYENHLVNAGGVIRPLAARVWPAAGDANAIVTSLRNEKNRINSYDAITNPLFKKWLSNTENVPPTDAATVIRINNWFNAPAPDATYESFRTFLGAPIVPVAAPPGGAAPIAGCAFPVGICPTVEQFMAMRTFNDFHLAAAANVANVSASLRAKKEAIDRELSRLVQPLAEGFSPSVNKLLEASVRPEGLRKAVGNNLLRLTSNLNSLNEFKNALVRNRDALLLVEKQYSALKDQIPRLDSVADPAKRAAISNLLTTPEETGLDDKLNETRAVINEYETHIGQLITLVIACENKQRDLTAIAANIAGLGLGAPLQTSSDIQPILIAPAGTRNPGNVYSHVVQNDQEALDILLGIEREREEREARELTVGGGHVIEVAPPPVNTLVVLPALADPRHDQQFVVHGVKSHGKLDGAFKVRYADRDHPETIVTPLSFSRFGTFDSLFIALGKVFDVLTITDAVAKAMAQELILGAKRHEEDNPASKAAVRLDIAQVSNAKLVYKYLLALNCPYEVKNAQKLFGSRKELKEFMEDKTKLKRKLEDKKSARAGLAKDTERLTSKRLRR